MNTLVWRLHRGQVVFAGGRPRRCWPSVLLITGIAMADDYHGFVADCAAARRLRRPQASCSAATASIIDWSSWPPWSSRCCFGLFWGAPLLATEFEDGTHSLAWTQGVTRRRWLSRTVAWALLAAAAWGGALAALVSWWRVPANALAFPGVRFDPGIFDIQGIVPVAYSVFAVALGIAAGAAFRRVLPAMATTFGRLRRPALRHRRIRPAALPDPGRPCSFRSAPATGRPAPGSSRASSPDPAGSATAASPSRTFPQPAAACGRKPSYPSCMTAHGYHDLITYQPAGRFWAFQGIEAGIFVVLAAALIAVTFRLVLARDA